LIDRPVSIAVELAIARMMRTLSCLLLVEALVFISKTLKGMRSVYYTLEKRCHIQTNHIAYIAIPSEKDYYFSDRIIFLY